MAKRKNGEDAEATERSAGYPDDPEDLTAGHPAGEYPAEGTFGYGTEPADPPPPEADPEPEPEAEKE